MLLFLIIILEGYSVFGLDNINDYYDKNLKYARLTEHGIKSDKIKKNVIIKSNKFFNYSFIKADIADHDFIVDFMIEKKFQNTSREISQETRSKINIILKKNEKKT